MIKTLYIIFLIASLFMFAWLVQETYKNLYELKNGVQVQEQPLDNDEDLGVEFEI